LSVHKINEPKKFSVIGKDKGFNRNGKINCVKEKSHDYKPQIYSKDRAFYLVKILGQGSFANVYLVKSKQSGYQH
jgi:hypothetical protein